MIVRRLSMTGLGLGYSPFASGTAGSAGAAAIALGIWAIARPLQIPAWGLWVIWLVLASLSTVGCGIWGRWAIEYFSKTARKKGDPGEVVLDEFAGQWMALIALPMTNLTVTLSVLALQFFLFRVFDVVKPPPAHQLEKLPEGWGIVADDLAAGIYANLIGQLALRFLILPAI